MIRFRPLIRRHVRLVKETFSTVPNREKIQYQEATVEEFDDDYVLARVIREPGFFGSGCLIFKIFGSRSGSEGVEN